MRKTPLILLTLAAVALPAAVLAAADPVDRVLQLPFGKPFDRDIPQCPTAAKPVADYCGLGQGYKQSRPPARAVAKLMPPPADSTYAVPAWVAMEPVSVEFGADGAVQRITAWTAGPARQDEVIESVSLRFGKPTELDLVAKQNAFGARMAVKRASWESPGVRVYHDCMDLNRCAVVFSVPKNAPAAAARPKAP